MTRANKVFQVETDVKGKKKNKPFPDASSVQIQLSLTSLRKVIKNKISK